MVKVKIIKAKYEHEEKYVGGIYEAFVMRQYDGNISNYAAKVSDYEIYALTPDQCEVVEEKPENNQSLKVLLVEDGSVDEDDIGEWCAENNIKMIVYRNGSTKPEFQKIKKGE